MVPSSVPSVRMTARGILWLRFGKAKDILKVLGMGRHQGGIVALLELWFLLRCDVSCEIL